MEDYKILKVKLNEESSSAHVLYFKQHNVSKSSGNEADSPNKRTLFVSNVPPYFTEQCLKNLFASFGKVEKVHFCTQPTSSPFTLPPRSANDSADNSTGYFDLDGQAIGSFKLAYLLFSQADSVEKSMKNSVDKEKVLTTNSNRDSLLSIGMKKWIESYKSRFIDVKKLKKEIDEFMKEYDENKVQKEQQEIVATNQPDDDGFITVTSKNRKANLRFTERNVEKLKFKQKKRRQQMQLVNFYSFQMKESKKEYIAQLRKKFDEDKKRIESMKQNRKFKPF